MRCRRMEAALKFHKDVLEVVEKPVLLRPPPPSTPTLYFYSPKSRLFCISWTAVLIPHAPNDVGGIRQGDWLLLAGAKLWNIVFFYTPHISLIFIQNVGTCECSLFCFVSYFSFLLKNSSEIWALYAGDSSGKLNRGDKSSLTNYVKGWVTTEERAGGGEVWKLKAEESRECKFPFWNGRRWWMELEGRSYIPTISLPSETIEELAQPPGFRDTAALTTHAAVEPFKPLAVLHCVCMCVRKTALQRSLQSLSFRPMKHKPSLHPLSSFFFFPRVYLSIFFLVFFFIQKKTFWEAEFSFRSRSIRPLANQPTLMATFLYIFLYMVKSISSYFLFFCFFSIY